MPRNIDIRVIFQHRLREARERASLSQKLLGTEAGLDPFVASTRINRYEQGVHQPDFATIQRMADVLKVPAAYLFAADERLARMILAFDRLTAGEKDQLLRQIDSR